MRIQHLRHLTLKITAILALGAIISACGGSRGTALDNLNNGGGGGAGNTLAQIGNGTGADFRAGEIGVGIGDTSLSAGGNTLLSVNVVNRGELITDSVTVSFNSPCIAAGTALLVPQAGQASDDDSSSNSVQTTNGQATIRYVANGCIGSDIVRATTTYGGSVISAQATLNVEADTVTSLTFVDSTPNYITLKGSGGTETSTVRFRVRGSTGAPVKDVGVNFNLNTTAGGLTLVNSSDVSGVDGYVYTTVQAGTVPTSVRITAVTDGGIATQSSELVVSTGMPDQNSFSIAASDIAPNSWRYNNIFSEITVNAADAFNNPAPIGTPIYFTTNGGAIDAACLVTAKEDNPDASSGTCSATWRSQSPKPLADVPMIVNEQLLRIECPPGVAECRNGRLKVVATTIGNESFIDVNGNGLYDPGVDIFYTADSPEGDTAKRQQNCRRNEPVSGSASHQTSGNISQAYGCDDLGDPYIDRNFNGRYDFGEEIATVSGQVDTQYDGPNGIYNGLLCRQQDEAAGLCSRDPVLVRADITLVMSCDVPLTMSDGRLPGQPTTPVAVPIGGSVSVSILLADCNGNGLPAGTEVSLDDDLTQNVQDAEIYPNGTLGMSTEPGVATIFLVGDDSDPASGIVFVELTIPGGTGGQITYGYGISLTSSN